MTTRLSLHRINQWCGGILALTALLVWSWQSLVPPKDPVLDSVASLRENFASLLSRARDCASRIASDDRLARWALSNNPDSIAASFNALVKAECIEGATIELLDARGNPLAWSGRDWLEGAHPLSREFSSEQVLVMRRGAYTALVLTASRDSGDSYIRIVTPLAWQNDVLSAVSPPVWFESLRLGEMRDLRLLSPEEEISESHASEDVHDDRGAVVARVVWDPSIERHPAAAKDARLTGTLLLLGLLLLLPWHGRHRLSHRLVLIASIWGIRLTAVALGIPTRMDLGPPTDPVVYASSFGSGLAATPFDLLLSSLALLASAQLLFYRRSSEPDGERRGPGPILSGLVILAGVGFLLLLTRGFAASVRSVIVDSTVEYHDRSVLVPSGGSVILLLSTFSLAYVLTLSWFWIMDVVSKAAHRLGFESPMYRWGAIAFMVFFTLGVYAYVDTSQVLPPWIPVILMICSMYGLHRMSASASANGRNGLKILTMLTVAVLTVDWHATQHRLENVRRDVVQRLSPGDAWLTFLMQSDLSSMATDRLAIDELADQGEASTRGTAFRLWAHSVMSRQPANSGIVIYDVSGREVDRFVTGFTTYEQDLILRTLFDGAEERIHVVEGPDLRRGEPVYGGWATVRDSMNRPFGTIATLLTPSSERPLFWAVREMSEKSNERRRQAEVVDSVVVRSDIPGVGEGHRVEPQLVRALDGDDRHWRWVRHAQAGGAVLWLRDPSDTRRIVATLVEDQDIRWRMFHGAKSLFVFLVLALLVAAARTILRVLTRRPIAVSFRARLFAVFTVLATAPLILLALYNKQISDERTQEEITSTLGRHGAILSQRMEELFQFESDLDQGLTDDFCASLAADLGIEFSIYRQEYVSASSRPEMFTSGILDGRLGGNVFAAIAVLGGEMIVERQTIGDVSYAVGYFPWKWGGRRAGILSIPTLFRQREIEFDLAERTAFIFLAYAFALLLTLILGWYFSERITRPLRLLTEASVAVGRGMSVSPLRAGRKDELGTLMLAFNHMVSELERSRDLLKKAEREHAWREMAKQVAHEIKNPLTPMKLSVQQLKQSFQDRAADREETLKEVSRTLLEQIEALSRIASEFSHFARLPHGKFERVDILALVRDALALFRSIPGVTLTHDLPSVRAAVIGDEDEVRRVFINLFRNSLQALEGEGEIRVVASVDRTILTINVSDTGPGVPEEMRSRIFEPNFSTKTEGMGLGLAISRRIVEDLGGTLTLEPASRGACFRISIPLMS